LRSTIQIWCGTEQLADGVTQSLGHVASLSVNGTRVIDRAQPIRAQWASFFARGNRQNTVQFEVERQFARTLDQLQFTHTRNDSLALSGIYKLVWEEADGTTLTVQIADAVWGEPVQATGRNLAATLKYECSGGKMTATVVDGDGGTVTDEFALPLFDLGSLDPLLIPTDKIATLNAGELCVACSLEVQGELNVNGELLLINP